MDREKLLDISRKGKTMPYTSLNGHMFSFVDKENELSLRLPKEVQTELIENQGGRFSYQYGAKMNGYAILPKNILDDEKRMKELFRISFEYIKSLKPKPTKRKKK